MTNEQQRAMERMIDALEGRKRGPSVTSMLGALAAMFIALIGCSALNAVVLCDLWAWFVVPLGVPALRFVPALGLALGVGMFAYRTAPKPTEDVKTEVTQRPWATLLTPVAGRAFVSLLTWGVGGWLHWMEAS